MNHPAALSVYYADHDIIIVDKPSMLLSVPGRGVDKQDCVSRRLQYMYGEIHVVHRLDWETSGVMIFARNKTALTQLQQQFMQRRIGKTYHALVAGKLNGRGMIDFPLIADWPRLPRQTVDYNRGKQSITYWQSIESMIIAGKTCTLLSLMPLTGRSHQLRIHLAAISHPILGDSLYAPYIVSKMALRLQLHAVSISFIHPLNGESMCFQSSAGFVHENC